jgi:hypothetical protein
VGVISRRFRRAGTRFAPVASILHGRKYDEDCGGRLVQRDGTLEAGGAMRLLKPLAVALVLVLAVGCTSHKNHGPSGHATHPTVVSPDREAAVYFPMLNHYLSNEISTPINTIGTVYIVNHTGVSHANGPRLPIEQSVQDNLTARFGGELVVKWVDSIDDVHITGRLDCKPSAKRNVVIELAKVPPTGNQVSVDLDGRADCGLAGGWHYIVFKTDGAWDVKRWSATWSA